MKLRLRWVMVVTGQFILIAPAAAGSVSPVPAPVQRRNRARGWSFSGRLPRQKAFQKFNRVIRIAGRIPDFKMQVRGDAV